MEKNVNQKENVQEYLEKEFYPTTYGKFVKFIIIMAIIATSVGLILAVFEAIVYARNLDINTYQKVIDFGEICFKCGSTSLFFYTLFYSGIIPHMMKVDKKEKSEKNFSTIVVFVLYALCMGAPMLKLIFEICALIW